jgi:hypothetical protein
MSLAEVRAELERRLDALITLESALAKCAQVGLDPASLMAPAPPVAKRDQPRPAKGELTKCDRDGCTEMFRRGFNKRWCSERCKTGTGSGTTMTAMLGWASCARGSSDRVAERIMFRT